MLSLLIPKKLLVNSHWLDWRYWGVQVAGESLAFRKSAFPPAPPKCSVTSGTFDHHRYNAMGAPLPPTVRSKIVRLLLLHWRPDAIAEAVHCNHNAVYEMQSNIFLYESPRAPSFRSTGPPRVVNKAAKNSLIAWLEEEPWAVQKEMVWFLWEEWGLHVHRSIISRVLKRRRWNTKNARRVGSRQNEEIRMHFVAELLDVIADQLVYIDESLFNETIEWRHRAYAPIGQPGRYHANRRREVNWSVLPAYTIDGQLSAQTSKLR